MAEIRVVELKVDCAAKMKAIVMLIMNVNQDWFVVQIIVLAGFLIGMMTVVKNLQALQVVLEFCRAFSWLFLVFLF